MLEAWEPLACLTRVPVGSPPPGGPWELLLGEREASLNQECR